jgi:V8-like Glu-specific endopeptidase
MVCSDLNNNNALPPTPMTDRIDATFLTTRCAARPTTGLTAFTDWEAFDGLLLMVYFGAESYDTIEGSAVMVAPGVALSAAHVISTWIAAVTLGKAGCMLTGFVKDGQTFWRATGVRVDLDTDLAIISLEPADNQTKKRSVRLAHLTTRTPKVGESLMFCGYRGAKTKFVHDGNEIELAATAYISTGKVSQIHAARRDRIRYRWPCYEADCVIIGGMSGGPVFDSDGYLIGICGAGLDILENGKPKTVSPSYAWQIWPCMLRRFRPTWPAKAYSGLTSLLEMKAGMCAIERPDTVKGDQSLGNGELGVVYQAWDKR